MQLRQRTKGIAIFTALILMVVVAGILTLLTTGLVNEMRSSSDDAAIVNTLMLARGGATMGDAILRNGVKDDLRDIILAANIPNTTSWAFGTIPTGQTLPTDSSVVSDLNTKIATPLQAKINLRLCPGNIQSTFNPTNNSSTNISLRIHVTSGLVCGKSLPNGIKLPSGRYIETQRNAYALPFVMVIEASTGQYKRSIAIQGEYQFNVAARRLSEFALLTNYHQNIAQSPIWFTNRTLFDGPVHTNQHFRFAGPAWFGDTITSSGCTVITATASDPCTTKNPGAYFNSTQRTNAQDIPNNPMTVNGITPRVENGADWSARYVKIPTSSVDQKAAAKAVDALTGLPTGNSPGLYINGNIYSLKLWAGNNQRNALQKVSGQWSPSPAPFQYIEYCSTSTRTSCKLFRQSVDVDGSKKFCNLVAPGSPPPSVAPENIPDVNSATGLSNWDCNTPFNGLIYVDGSVGRFSGPARVPSNSSDPNNAPPALASFAQITLASLGQTRITGDLKYEDLPCTGYPTEVNGTINRASCTNLTAQNVLGIYADDEKILIGNQNNDATLNAPENVTINAVMMSGAKEVAVENHDQGQPRGCANILGGIIENYYGAFGTFSGNNATSGYGRCFTYDKRLKNDLAPPYFPTSDTPDLGKDVFVFSFGQREQVE
jgi:Domain of unknown function (DUF4900)